MKRPMPPFLTPPAFPPEKPALSIVQPDEETPGKSHAEKQKEFLAMDDGYQPGAIIDSSWGYDQTNIDFYRIVKRTPKGTLTLEPLHSIKDYSITSMSGNCVPGKPKDSSDHDIAWPDQKAKEKRLFTRRLRIHNGKPSGVSIKHGWANLWNGKPLYHSCYA